MNNKHHINYSHEAPSEQLKRLQQKQEVVTERLEELMRAETENLTILEASIPALRQHHNIMTRPETVAAEISELVALDEDLRNFEARSYTAGEQQVEPALELLTEPMAATEADDRQSQIAAARANVDNAHERVAGKDSYGLAA